MILKIIHLIRMGACALWLSAASRWELVLSFMTLMMTLDDDFEDDGNDDYYLKVGINLMWLM